MLYDESSREMIAELIDFHLWLLNSSVYFGVLFVFIWIFVSFILSIITGWNRLAGKYRSEVKPRTKLVKAIPVLWGIPIICTDIYMLSITRAGIYLRVLFVFRFGHPPLLIPWEDVSARKVERIFGNNIQLSFGNGLSPPFEISEKNEENIKIGSKGYLSF